ncbi:hypothetical protein J2W33_001745 [Variovorax boronicumulans]|nr:hypothetical protein [Variovorax boronicumulans]
MQSKSALIAGILAGIASPSTIGAPVKFERLQGSDLSRMRGDVTRIGGDFSSVINRERGNKKASLKAGKSNAG